MISSRGFPITKQDSLRSVAGVVDAFRKKEKKSINRLILLLRKLCKARWTGFNARLCVNKFSRFNFVSFARVARSARSDGATKAGRHKRKQIYRAKLNRRVASVRLARDPPIIFLFISRHAKCIFRTIAIQLPRSSINSLARCRAPHAGRTIEVAPPI